MTRAERRRMERQAKKIARSGNVTESDVAAMLAEEERKEQVRRSIALNNIANRAVEIQNKMDMDSILLSAANQAYKDWCQKYEKKFVTIFYIAASMAIMEHFPKWTIKAVQKFVHEIEAWIQKYSGEYHGDLTAFKNMYAVWFGEPMVVNIEEAVLKNEKKDLPKETAQWEFSTGANDDDELLEGIE